MKLKIDKHTNIGTQVCVAIGAIFLAVSIAYTLDALSFHGTSRFTPLLAGSIVSALLILYVARETKSMTRLRATKMHGSAPTAQVDCGDAGPAEDKLNVLDAVNTIKYLAVIIVFAWSIGWFGLTVSSSALVFCLLKFDARWRLIWCMLSVVVIYLFLEEFGRVLQISWPTGTLF